MNLSSVEKAELYNNALHQIEDILSNVNKKLGESEPLLILSSILKDYDLDTASNLVKANCEPFMTKGYYEDKHFDEGDETTGYVSLKSLLTDIETILNCDTSTSNIHFTDLLRIETDEEKKENGHSLGVEWFATDEDRLIEDTYVGFEDTTIK